MLLLEGPLVAPRFEQEGLSSHVHTLHWRPGPCSAATGSVRRRQAHLLQPERYAVKMDSGQLS